MNEEDDIKNAEQPSQEPFGVPLDETGKKTHGKSPSSAFTEGISDEEYETISRKQNAKYSEAENNQRVVRPQTEADTPPAPLPKSPKEEAAPEKPPGGKVMNFLNRIPGLNRTKSRNEDRTKTSPEDESSSEDNTKRNVAKLAESVQKAKKWIKGIGMAIKAGGPVLWIILAVGLILIIIFFIVGLSYFGSTGKNVSSSGGTILRAVDAKTDAPKLENFLKLTGDTSVADTTRREATRSIKNDLLNAKDQPPIKGDTALTTAADKAINALSVLEGTTVTSANVTGAVTPLEEFYDLLEGTTPVWQASAGPTRLPVAGTVTTFNTELHGYSFLNSAQVNNHNVYIRSNDGKEQCDAVDIGVTLNDKIYPMFGGTITDISSDGNGDTSKKIVVTSTDGKYTALYAHLLPGEKNKGDTITIADELGLAVTNNVQIEVYYTDGTGNSCLVTNHADFLDHALKSRRHADWGGYLWDRIVKTFNLK